MINNFGQTPTQLLTEPHPKRMNCDEARELRMRHNVILGRSVFSHDGQLKAHAVKVCSCMLEKNISEYDFNVALPAITMLTAERRVICDCCCANLTNIIFFSVIQRRKPGVCEHRALQKYISD